MPRARWDRTPVTAESIAAKRAAKQKTEVAQAAQKVIPIKPADPGPAHAKLSCSGSERWLACTPSVFAEEPFPNLDTEYSKEGTLAHDIGARHLTAFLAGSTFTTEEANRVAFDQGLQRFINDAFHAAVLEYVRRCIIAIGEARRETPDALILVEQRLDLTQWIPGGFGTGDLVIITERLCRVRDLKFGAGKHVDVVDNPQLKLYGLGAIAMYHALYGFDRVRIEIDQPRRNNVAWVEYSVAELLEWAETVVKPRAALAAAGQGEMVAGDHCDWCRAKNVCAKRAEQAQELATAEFMADPPDKKTMETRLTQEQIEALLPKAATTIKFLQNLLEYAAAAAIDGRRKWSTHKLVAGRSNRIVTDQDGLVAEMQLMGGVDEALLYKPREVVGIGEMEKLVGEKVFEQLSAPFVTKPAGKPTLVPISDKRPEWVRENNADEQFAE